MLSFLLHLPLILIYLFRDTFCLLDRVSAGENPLAPVPRRLLVAGTSNLAQQWVP